MSEMLHLRNKNPITRKKNIENYYAHLFSKPECSRVFCFASKAISHNLDFTSLTPSNIDPVFQERDFEILLQTLKQNQTCQILDIHTFLKTNKKKQRFKKAKTTTAAETLDQTIDLFMSQGNLLKDSVGDFVIQEDSNFFHPYNNKEFNKKIKTLWKVVKKTHTKKDGSTKLQVFTDIYSSTLEHHYLINHLDWNQEKAGSTLENLSTDSKKNIATDTYQTIINKAQSLSHTKNLNLHLVCNDIKNYTDIKNYFTETENENISIDETPALLGLDSFSACLYSLKQHKTTLNNTLFIDAGHLERIKALLIYE